MSTTFGIFKIPIETDDYGNILTEYTEEDYDEVAFRSNKGMIWLHPYAKTQHAFKENFPVYALDNTPQGIYTVKDIRNFQKR